MAQQKYTQAQIEAAALSMGFQNAEIMLAHFKEKLLREGLYEALNAKARRQKQQSSKGNT